MSREAYEDDSGAGLGSARQLEAAFVQAMARFGRRAERFSLALLEVTEAEKRRGLEPAKAKVVGEKLLALARPEDTVCRLGDQTFAVLLAGAAHNEAVNFAQRVLAALDRASLAAEEGASLAVRPGVVEWSEGRGTLAQLLEDARWALERPGAEQTPGTERPLD